MPTSAVPLMTLLDLVEESQHGTGHHPVVVHCQYAVHVCFFTGPPAHSVGGQTSNGHWRLSSSSVVCNTPQRQNTTHRGAACDGGPVVLRPVKATPCFLCQRNYYVLGLSIDCVCSDDLIKYWRSKVRSQKAIEVAKAATRHRRRHYVFGLSTCCICSFVRTDLLTM